MRIDQLKDLWLEGRAQKSPPLFPAVGHYMNFEALTGIDGFRQQVMLKVAYLKTQSSSWARARRPEYELPYECRHLKHMDPDPEEFGLLEHPKWNAYIFFRSDRQAAAYEEPLLTLKEALEAQAGGRAAIEKHSHLRDFGAYCSIYPI